MKAARDFRDFILRGNVIDLAVGIVIGVAFGTVIQAFVKDLITPLIAIFGKGADFSTYHFTIGKSQFLYGDFINALIAFLIIAAVVFFLVVRPVNRLMARYKKEPAPDAPSRECPYCMSRIPAAATRCAFCTSEVTPDVAPAAMPTA